MELDTYLRVAIKRSYILLLLLGVAVFGVWMYFNVSSEQKAVAVLAVLQPGLPAPGEYLPPRLGFDALDNSRELKERVAARMNDGTSVEQLESKISIELRPALRGTPLYEVAAKDKDKERATYVADLAVEEAQKLYDEINKPDSKDLRRAFQPELSDAQANVEAARTHLNLFLAENDAYALPERMDQQMSLISQLRMTEYSSSQAGLTAGNSASLSAARKELERLIALEPDYNRLAFETKLADEAVAHLETQQSQLAATSNSPQEDIQSRLDAAKWRTTKAQAGVGGALYPDRTYQLSDLFEIQLAQGSVGRLEQQLSEADIAVSSLESARKQTQAELDKAMKRAGNAHDALSAFQQANNVFSLHEAIQAQMAMVNQLTVLQAASSANAKASSKAIEDAILKEDAELQRLKGLEAEYIQLNQDLSKAEASVSSMEERVVNTVLGQLLPARAQIKVLQPASLESDLWGMVIAYAVGVLLAIFLSLTIFYLLAVFERVPPSIHELEREFGLPVLTRVPKATG